MVSPFMSQEYLVLCQEMHNAKPWGTTGHSYIDEFLPFAWDLRCDTLLDYGCGRDSVRKELEKRGVPIEVFSYDPAIPEFSGLPDPADFVVCTDVMEHVEEEYVSDVLGHICSLATKGAYFCIALKRAKRNLPDGRNAHITIQPSSWWMERIQTLPWKVVWSNPGKKSLRLVVKQEKK